jgi:hypothetical protein
MSHTRLYTQPYRRVRLLHIPMVLRESLYPCLWTFDCIIAYAYYGVFVDFCFIVYLGGHVLMIYLSFLVHKNSSSCSFIVLLVRPLVLFRRRC